jgi:ABC-2 type transport system permease protein
MYLRMLVETPPTWQIGLSLVLSVGTIILLISLAGKIYRVGLLMTGKKPSFKDTYHWLKA